MKATDNISFFAFLFFILFTPFGASASTFVSNSTLQSDTEWTLDESPYYGGTVTVPAGVTLTIDPGVVVKLNALDVVGTLDANGSAENPVVFTSYYDDTFGGDTDGTGTTTNPTPWSGITFSSGSVGNVSHAVVSYGGMYSFNSSPAAITNTGGTLTISDSIFSNNNSRSAVELDFGTTTVERSSFSGPTASGPYPYGIYASGGTFSVDGSDFHDNVSAAIYTKNTDLTLTNSTFEHNKDAPVAFSWPGSFIHSSNHLIDNAYNGYSMSGTLDRDALLTDDGYPYIVSSVTVPASTTLAIDPNVVIKMTGALYAIGSVNSFGTAAKPVTFTSLHDDSVGGDTESDGALTTPASRDWQLLEAAEGGAITMTYTNIKYGGRQSSDFFSRSPMIGNLRGTLTLDHTTIDGGRASSGSGVYNSDGTTTITHSFITGNEYGIFSDGGTTDVHQSSITGNDAGVATTNLAGLSIHAENNWWGDSSGPTALDNPGGKGQNILGQISYTPWLTSDPYATSTASSTPSVPVIIIPGILGSADVEGQLVMDPILHVYDDFISTFEANGYVVDKTIFPFPYDWRNSNVNTAQILKLKIDQVKQICGCDKVDLVAHSMGGLVARQYIESGAYENDVRDMVFIGTPHLGAPEDYLTWEGATDVSLNLQDWVMDRMITEEGKHAGYDNLFDYIHQRPVQSLQELLPIYAYKSDSQTSFTLEPYNSVNYPTNSFLENLDANKQVLSSLNVLNIVGDTGSTTVGKIVTATSTQSPLWQHGQPINLINPSPGLFDVEGDDTVPLSSSESLGSSTVLAFDHTDLVDESSALAFKFLNGTPATNVIINPNRKNYSYIFVRMFSPIDSLVTAPDGKRIGKDPVTGQDMNEIPGAYFTGSNTDNEFMVIPNPLDGSYVIQTEGKDDGGSYTVSTSYLSQSTSTDTAIQGVTLPGSIQTIDFQMSSTSTSPIVVTSPDHITASSTISDIQQAFALGWIKKPNIETELINKVQKVLKAQTKIDTVTTKVNGKNVAQKVSRITMVIDQTLGRALLLDLKAYTRDKLTLQGYNLINDDLNWLLNN